jgi:flagellar motor component MotA
MTSNEAIENLLGTTIALAFIGTFAIHIIAFVW